MLDCGLRYVGDQNETLSYLEAFGVTKNTQKIEIFYKSGLVGNPIDVPRKAGFLLAWENQGKFHGFIV